MRPAPGPLLITVDWTSFCCKSSMKISIDDCYCNRFIHLGRPIFPVNHNSASVYNPDHIWDRPCVCYTRKTPDTQSAAWVLEHGYSTAWSSYCSVNPLRRQWLYLLPVPPACWYKLNCNRFNDHERLFFSHHRSPAIHHFFLLAVIAGDCAMTWAFHVLLHNDLSIPRAPEKKCLIKIS